MHACCKRSAVKASEEASRESATGSSLTCGFKTRSDSLCLTQRPCSRADHSSSRNRSLKEGRGPTTRAECTTREALVLSREFPNGPQIMGGPDISGCTWAASLPHRHFALVAEAAFRGRACLPHCPHRFTAPSPPPKKGLLMSIGLLQRLESEEWGPLLALASRCFLPGLPARHGLYSQQRVIQELANDRQGVVKLCSHSDKLIMQSCLFPNPTSALS
ncbi:unnamed protein product [Prorocentrum cordatum]|uniref:Uncharacterized protein n=1 Tax=Prorocentrum cordatum TaxID=2364126 RepID=A0ABN9SEF7_9DINO|nr:unnamed protein product [Polarella glacialis]